MAYGTIINIFEDVVKRCPSVSMNSEIMEGQPCINGTRIPVRSILRALEMYGSVDAVRKCYPQLSRQQIEDALFFSQVILELPQ